MTAEEIRDEIRVNVQSVAGVGAIPDLMLMCYGMLGEIAAQLAELNERLRPGNLIGVNVFHQDHR